MQIYKDCSWDMYFTPETAIEYGIIDQIITTQQKSNMEKRNRRGSAQQARQQQRRAVDDGPEASAG